MADSKENGAEPSPATRETPEDEVLLFITSEPSAPNLEAVEPVDFVLEDPPPEITEHKSLITSALRALDPIEQKGVVEDPLSGKRLLPGLVPLLGITGSALFLVLVALVATTLFSLQYARGYLVPFLVAHAVFMGHLWAYHVGYRTRRRFLVLRQTLFIAVLAGFVCYMIWDMIEHPPSLARVTAQLSNQYAVYLWVGFAGNSISAGLILLHWLVLGRGYREIDDPVGHARRLLADQEGVSR